MKIYHGSKNVIKAPLYGLGKVGNDFGLGFYCTESEEKQPHVQRDAPRIAGEHGGTDVQRVSRSAGGEICLDCGRHSPREAA